MKGDKYFSKIGKEIIDSLDKGELKLSLFNTKSCLTRFANNEIHQNVLESNLEATLTYQIKNSVGITSTNEVTPTGLKKALKEAQEIAHFMPENPYLPDLLEPQEYQKVDSVSESTLEVNPKERAEVVGKVIDKAKNKGANAYGAITSESGEIFIMNSRGLEAYYPFTKAEFRVIFLKEGGSGYGEDINSNFYKLNVEKVSQEALNTCLATEQPQSIEPGEYEVVLKHYATADILQFISFLSFNGKAAEEGRSYIKLKMGSPVASPLVTIYDDGLDKNGLPIPFDFEGFPKKKVTLIDKGVASGLVYDVFTAKKAGIPPTGHTLPSTESHRGAMPFNLFMEPGEHTLEQMVSSVKKGIFVTRFHYVNPIDPVRVISTGMTRDGTFLIEDGKIVKPIKNLRFTQSFFEALEGVEMVGKERYMVPIWFGSVLAPALKINRFRFTGVTEF